MAVRPFVLFLLNTVKSKSTNGLSFPALVFSFQLHRLVFSLRHSKEERKDLDWEQEEKGRRARREAEESNNSDAGKKESHRQME